MEGRLLLVRPGAQPESSSVIFILARYVYLKRNPKRNACRQPVPRVGSVHKVILTLS